MKNLKLMFKYGLFFIFVRLAHMCSQYSFTQEHLEYAMGDEEDYFYWTRREK